MLRVFLDGSNRSFGIKTLDFILYFATFGGITFIAGSIVHALSFSLFSVILLVMGLAMYITSNYIRNQILEQGKIVGRLTWEQYIVSIITAVSAGIISGGILHWQEGPRFGLYLVLSGFALSLSSNLLYGTKSIKHIFRDYLISLAMFSGISFVSGSIVHSMNAWFSNFILVAIGILLTPGAIMIKQRVSGSPKQGMFNNTLIIVFLSLGIGGITGGVLHFTINVDYAIKLIVGGFAISYLAALFKNEGSLVDLRK